MDNESLLRLTNQIKRKHLEDVMDRLRDELYKLNENRNLNEQYIDGFLLAFRIVAESEEWL
jgi:uncharacterized protein YaaW (UPF0174 family)